MSHANIQRTEVAPTSQPHADAQPLIGWWRLVSCDVEFRDSHTSASMYKAPVQGYLVFSPDGRMMAFAAARPQGIPVSDKECADAYRCLTVYSGTYRVEGDKWVTDVDAAWYEGWIGTGQERMFRIESGQLKVTSQWYSSPLHGNAVVRAHLLWARDFGSAPPN
jgi:hypothetical protein